MGPMGAVRDSETDSSMTSQLLPMRISTEEVWIIFSSGICVNTSAFATVSSPLAANVHVCFVLMYVKPMRVQTLFSSCINKMIELQQEQWQFSKGIYDEKSQIAAFLHNHRPVVIYIYHSLVHSHLS
jgi:hypothetical protein